ncbi:uncharacterized protein E0L32_005003 [Thyridium curvatum]|uniref:DUF7924 domain-containing protein n=1 Tax=Thyridium curvatum TaxID=1093900 RepID=A0A507B8F7_9PEZI|nr:uncharacterized protein E0L32_005003 [Thyridium curvatum]TPX14894.1 hypothetical protein E0L32_005003 [Thyridium curvatum]
MNGGISKTRTRRSGVRLSKALQETLLAAVARAGAEPPQSPEEQSPVGRYLPWDALLQSTKRSLDATFDIDPLPAKRARQQPPIGNGRPEQAAEQPKPKRPTRPYASFLKDFIDPVRPNRPDSLDAFVSEWLESIGSDREKRCRSDSHLYHTDDDPVSRQLARSAPEMGYTTGADGFTVPPTRPSLVSRSYQATEDSASSTARVRHPSYRQNNLGSNGVYVRDSRNQLPDHVSCHVETLRTKKRDSPGPSSEQIDGYLDGLDSLARGCTEADVEGFLEDTVFPKVWDRTYGSSAGLGIAKSSLMSSHLIPNNPESPFRVSGPKPDLLYGYSGYEAFTQPQFLAQASLHRNARFAEATTQGLRFPFLAVEFKAAGGTQGDLWVAANQCAGASSACLSAMSQLNKSLQEYQRVERVDNFSYSIAVDNNTAQIYISWKEDDLNYCLQRVDAFLLSRPEEFKDFRSRVRNILDWGKDTRLTQIRDALDVILEEHRKRASEVAKSRLPPSVDSATTSHNASSSRRTRSDGAR